MLAHLMIGGKWNSHAVSTKHSAGITTIRDDDLLRRNDRNNRCGSNGVALWSLELATALGGFVAVAPLLDLLVHSFEAFFHRLFPLHRLIDFQLFLHNLMQPILTLESHLKKDQTKFQVRK